MIEPVFPENEEQRQLAVERYEILDTMPESCFDDITAMVSQISGAPISLITMLDHDRNYLKSHHGVPFSESPRNISFCGHAINLKDEIMVIEDASKDERFADNPLVTEHGVAFYAGVPLNTPDGYRLGTLCLFDVKPRVLGDDVKSILLTMARQVEQLLDLRIKNTLLRKTQNELEAHNDELSKFARTISHDIKSPLTSLLYLTDTLIEDSDDEDDLTESLDRIKNSASSLAGYADDLLDYYLSGETNRDLKERTDIQDIFNDIKLMSGSAPETEMHFNSDCNVVYINKASVCQVLVNLVSNAAKYTDKDKTLIAVECKAEKNDINLTVTDNGMGIPLNKLDSIFELFETTENKDRNGKVGTGIGLSTAKKIVTSMGGDMSVQSKIGVGTTFFFNIPNALLSSDDSQQAAA